MKRYGGTATVCIEGIGAPDDVRRHIEDIHPLGDVLDYIEGNQALTLTLEQGGNTAALGALASLLDGLDEALDPCTDPATVRITAATAVPVPDEWKPAGKRAGKP